MAKTLGTYVRKTTLAVDKHDLPKGTRGRIVGLCPGADRDAVYVVAWYPSRRVQFMQAEHLIEYKPKDPWEVSHTVVMAQLLSRRIIFPVALLGGPSYDPKHRRK